MHGPHGLFDLAGNIGKIMLGTESPRALLGHRTAGAADFPAWPRWSDVTHQAVPRSGLQRAVEGGLRLIVMMAVNSRILGSLTRGADYDDMPAVDRQLQAAKEFEATIDKEAGGPGRGWYRIAYSAAQARQIIDDGKAAVVLGIEVDHLFGDVIGPHSTPDDLAAQVKRYHDLGVRHVFPIHLENCAYGRAAFALNLHWSRNGGPISKVNPPLSLPVFRMNTAPRPGGYDYRAGHCNTGGLTPLGETLIRLLMEHHMMIDVDHMSAASRADTLRLTGAAGYPVVAGHAEVLAAAEAGRRSERLLTDDELTAIGRHGGIVAPLLRQMSIAVSSDAKGTAEAFLAAYRRVLRRLPEAAIPFGSDLNGFAGLPCDLRRGRPLEYPFNAPVTRAALGRSRLGRRSFDLNTDGIAHVGMLPDFVAHLFELGLSEEEGRPLLDSALGYVRAWEQSSGY
ncbi:membrane dipeptidase [Micromonospora sp. CPCC 206171]|uniref:membrane dipeptidase n=1 Tax=Micromonospora sp. CPCC 206171 TaxID=3122405 RepID=UPI002FEEBEDE